MLLQTYGVVSDIVSMNTWAALQGWLDGKSVTAYKLAFAFVHCAWSHLQEFQTYNFRREPVGS